MLNLLPNEDELTIRVQSGGIIPGHSSNDNDNDNQFEQCSSHPCNFGRPARKFEHVPKFCVMLQSLCAESTAE